MPACEYVSAPQQARIPTASLPLTEGVRGVVSCRPEHLRSGGAGDLHSEATVGGRGDAGVDVQTGLADRGDLAGAQVAGGDRGCAALVTVVDLVGQPLSRCS